MTVEQRADDPAAQHSLERFVLLAWFPLRYNFFTVRKTADVQALRVCWSTTKAREIRGVCFLDTFNHGLRGFFPDLLSQFKPLNLSRRRVRQLSNEHVPARLLEPRQRLRRQLAQLVLHLR